MNKLHLKKHQKEVINHLKRHRGVLAVHSMGTGKTWIAVYAALSLLKRKIVSHVIFVSPVSLQQNFIKSLIDANDNHRFDVHLPKGDIENKFKFYTIQGFIHKDDLCKNSLLIIDEAHNLRTKNGKYFNQLLSCAKEAKRVLLLSGTPIINRPSDIVNLVALLKGIDPVDMTEFYHIIKTSKEAEKYFSDVFHFHDRLESDSNFPKTNVIEKYFRMSGGYEKLYSKIEDGEAAGVDEFKEKNIKAFYNGVRRATNKIEKVSPKLLFIYNNIKKAPSKKYVIFSHFHTMGLKVIDDALKELNIKTGSVTGEVNEKYRQKIVDRYNEDEINVLFISKAGGEGLNLKETDIIFVMEPTWHMSALNQIIGRGARYKSHKDKKAVVTIYLLYLVRNWEYKRIKELTKNEELIPPENEEIKMFSIDLFLRNWAINKEYINKDFLKQMRKYKI